MNVTKSKTSKTNCKVMEPTERMICAADIAVARTTKKGGNNWARDGLFVNPLWFT